MVVFFSCPAAAGLDAGAAQAIATCHDLDGQPEDSSVHTHTTDTRGCPCCHATGFLETNHSMRELPNVHRDQECMYI